MLYSIMFWVLAVIAGLAVLAIACAALEKLGLMDLGEDSEPFNTSQFISASIVAILFAAGAGWAYTAKEESALDRQAEVVALQEQKENEAAMAEAQRIEEEKIAAENKMKAEIERCISVAIELGYRNGQCANGFIKACLTGSRKEVHGVLRTDEMLGVNKSWSCPNMGTTYADAFDEQYDKF